jgi:hypothetical protein
VRVADLPNRIRDGQPSEPVLSVDGAWDAPGLNLSHWPGNRTPPELRHDLSTGCALAFSRLPEARQQELARGCTAIANNHYDTDGVCALFAPAERRSQAASRSRPRPATYRVPRARLALDALGRRSGRGRGGAAAHQASCSNRREVALDSPGGLEGLGHWQPEPELRADQRRARGRPRTRSRTWSRRLSSGDDRAGRHALREGTRTARWSSPASGGTHARLVVNTSSCSELAPARLPRRTSGPAARLNGFEGAAGSAPAGARRDREPHPEPGPAGGFEHLRSTTTRSPPAGGSDPIKRTARGPRAAWVFPTPIWGVEARAALA